VILGDAAFSLAAFEGGSLVAFRSRRRDCAPDEPERLRDEAIRTAALAGTDAPGRIAVLGPGTPDVVRGLRELGLPAEPAWRAGAPGLPLEAAELAWLGAALG